MNHPTPITRFKRTCIACALALVAVPVASLAQEPEFAHRAYLDLGLGLSDMDPELDGTGFGLEDDSDTAWRLKAGFDLADRWALEIFQTNLGDAGLSPQGEAEHTARGADVQYYLYRAHADYTGLSAFVRAGVASMKISDNQGLGLNGDTHGMLGAGVEYGFGHGWGVRLDADTYGSDTRFYALTVLKRFGGAAPAPAPVMAAAPAPAPAPKPVVKDDDGDGVPNTRDRCPATVTGAEVNAQGCELDTDGDGVVNRLDACPATAKGKAVDTKGCELPVVIRLEGVTFETGSARLTPASLTILDEVAETLRKNPDVRVEVAGHTDDRGRRDFNVKLSRQRAEAVRDYLVNKGIAADRLSARGYGPDQPAADNASAEGRAMNRRVELKILNP